MIETDVTMMLTQLAAFTTGRPNMSWVQTCRGSRNQLVMQLEGLYSNLIFRAETHPSPSVNTLANQSFYRSPTSAPIKIVALLLNFFLLFFLLFSSILNNANNNVHVSLRKFNRCEAPLCCARPRPPNHEKRRMEIRYQRAILGAVLPSMHGEDRND